MTLFTTRTEKARSVLTPTKQPTVTLAGTRAQMLTFANDLETLVGNFAANTAWERFELTISNGSMRLVSRYPA